jgi:hypothetical protein
MDTLNDSSPVNNGYSNSPDNSDILDIDNGLDDRSAPKDTAFFATI